MSNRKKIKTFEDLIAWEKSKNLSLAIYKATSTGQFSRDYGLREQIRRASVSVMANIAEGFGRYGVKEFRSYLSIANGSAYEVRSQLHLARDLGYLKQEEADRLINNCHEVSRIILGLRRSTRDSVV